MRIETSPEKGGEQTAEADFPSGFGEQGQGYTPIELRKVRLGRGPESVDHNKKLTLVDELTRVDVYRSTWGKGWTRAILDIIFDSNLPRLNGMDPSAPVAQYTLVFRSHIMVDMFANVIEQQQQHAEEQKRKGRSCTWLEDVWYDR